MVPFAFELVQKVRLGVEGVEIVELACLTLHKYILGVFKGTAQAVPHVAMELRPSEEAVETRAVPPVSAQAEHVCRRARKLLIKRRLEEKNKIKKR